MGRTFEEMLVEQCAPTLVGIKPASLFRYQAADRLSSIQTAARWARDQDVALTWDETCGQYYGEKETEDGLCRLWLEDARSLGLKMDRIREYDLAGVAGWKLGLESPEAWDVVTWTAVTD